MAFKEKNPNQKDVTVHKEPCNRENIYAMFNLAAFNKAMADLNSSAFILWLYIAENQEGYNFALSNVAFKNATGIGKTAYDNAIKELIDKRYLVVVEGKKTSFNFYETPLEEAIVVGPQNNDRLDISDVQNEKVSSQYNDGVSLQDDNTTKSDVTIQRKVGSQYNEKQGDNTRNITRYYKDTTENSTTATLEGKLIPIMGYDAERHIRDWKIVKIEEQLYRVIEEEESV